MRTRRLILLAMVAGALLVAGPAAAAPGDLTLDRCFGYPDGRTECEPDSLIAPKGLAVSPDGCDRLIGGPGRDRLIGRPGRDLERQWACPQGLGGVPEAIAQRAS